MQRLIVSLCLALVTSAPAAAQFWFPNPTPNPNSVQGNIKRLWDGLGSSDVKVTEEGCAEIAEEMDRFTTQEQGTVEFEEDDVWKLLNETTDCDL